MSDFIEHSASEASESESDEEVGNKKPKLSEKTKPSSGSSSSGSSSSEDSSEEEGGMLSVCFSLS